MLVLSVVVVLTVMRGWLNKGAGDEASPLWVFRCVCVVVSVGCVGGGDYSTRYPEK